MIAQRALIQKESDPLTQKCGGRGGQVTTCEGFPPMARLATRMLTWHGMGADVALVSKRSNDMEVGKDIPRKADLLVCMFRYLKLSNRVPHEEETLNKLGTV